MCGIAGFFGESSRDELERMIGAIKHRGPDDGGVEIDDLMGFAHARLSIIDISPGGHQPMMLPDESVTIVFNGEIYNYKELRDQLLSEGCVFRGTSDTEVILQLYRKKGTDCFKDLVGMFAIALYDKKAQTLLLVRDRMGEKPLYWTKVGDTILFASELRALLESSRVPRRLNKQALKHYLFSDYVPTPLSIIENVYKLEPATILICTRASIEKRKYWSPPGKVTEVSLTDACEQLDRALRTSVSREVLAADVPLGVFLSGGLDSSTIAYYAQRSSRRPVDTFSIGFDDPSFDESRYAREVAGCIGSNHHEEKLSIKAALDLVSEIPDVFSEPVADASVLPTMLLSRFARKSVTVALGGDGGDELFAGYPTFQADGISSLYARLPSGLQNALRSAGESLPSNYGNFSFSYNLKKFLSSSASSDVKRHLEWLAAFPPDKLTLLKGPALLESDPSDLFSAAYGFESEMKGNDVRNRLLYVYARTYLMDEVLVKVDRASMRYALETRAPFLDHTVVDLVFSLPYSLKYKRGTTKYILKTLMQGKLPETIVNRKKKGFGIPLARWLMKELKPLCEELLGADSLKKHDLFDLSYVNRIKREHFDGKRDNRKELWNLMVFQLWYNRWMR